jgi:hypothetical protein
MYAMERPDAADPEPVEHLVAQQVALARSERRERSVRGGTVNTAYDPELDRYIVLKVLNHQARTADSARRSWPKAGDGPDQPPWRARDLRGTSSRAEQLRSVLRKRVMKAI